MISRRLRRIGIFSQSELFVIEQSESIAEASPWQGIYCYASLQPLAIIVKRNEVCEMLDISGSPLDPAPLFSEVSGLRELFHHACIEM